MPKSAILWQNLECTITLLDVPQSISTAQGTEVSPNEYSLLSTCALETPYESNEPKSNGAKAKLQSNTVHGTLHAVYGAMLTDALGEVRKHHRSDWHHPRSSSQGHLRESTKRKLDKLEQGDGESSLPVPTPRLELSGDSLRTLANGTNPNSVMVEIKYEKSGIVKDDSWPIELSLANNSTDHPATLTITPLLTFLPVKYHIPPHSTFSLSNCSTSPFHDLGATFNMIILDPPWPSRSVKRTHQNPSGGAYSTESDMVEMRALFKNLHLETLMAEHCVVGIWMTNKAAVRELVLDGREALFGSARWDLEVLEEWVWLKTTARGEPVSELGSLWRKPYEVFLIGRRRKTEEKGDSQERENELVGNVCMNDTSATHQILPGHAPAPKQIKRRVMISVPDLHSRKPCLKELLLQSGLLAKEGATLEIFARHLVAGWSSWGDECIKFNWEGCWNQSAHSN